MEGIILLSILVGVSLVAYILGVRDQIASEKALVYKLKKNYGEAPKREYKPDELDHLLGYYKNHPEDFQIDDATWNDLNMDGVFARMNYCLSATGEEYLYYMLRTPKQIDDYSPVAKLPLNGELATLCDEGRLEENNVDYLDDLIDILEK